MKYDVEKSFGYPVLSTHSDDYLKSDFQADIEFNINAENPKEFLVDYTFACGLKEMRELVTKGQAAYWLKVACRATFYSKMHEVKAAGVLQLDGHDLRDLVEFSGFVIAKNDGKLASERINPEFGFNSFEFSNGQVLAQAAPTVYVTDKEFWKPISSVFEYRHNDELKDGEYTIDLDNEEGFVQIFANENQCKSFKDFEKTKEGKIILLNTVFTIAVSKMVEALKEKPEDYTDKKWARILIAKAASKNINLNDPKMLVATHRLLDRPLTSLAAAILDK
jgi:hypothetical protein